MDFTYYYTFKYLKLLKVELHARAIRFLSSDSYTLFSFLFAAPEKNSFNNSIADNQVGVTFLHVLSIAM
jgi:hypothetical protein